MKQYPIPLYNCIRYWFPCVCQYLPAVEPVPSFNIVSNFRTNLARLLLTAPILVNYYVMHIQTHGHSSSLPHN